MITAAPPQPPAIEQPAPYQLSYGVVTGIAAPGTRRVLVRVGHRTLADLPFRGRRFHLRVALPMSRDDAQVVTVTARADVPSPPCPMSSAHPSGCTSSAREALDALLARGAQALGRRSAALRASTSRISQPERAQPGTRERRFRPRRPSSSGSPSRRSRSQGRPRPWLDARRPAAEMLDLLRQRRGERDRALVRRLDVRWLRARERADALDRARRHGDVRRLRVGTRWAPATGPRGGIPLRVESQPSWGHGKRTSAYDLATLLRIVWLAGGGHGPLHAAQPGFSQTDARYLLYLLAQVRDPGKLDREVGRLPGVPRPPQGRLGQQRPARQRDRALAGRRIRRHRDDLPAGRRGTLVRRSRRPGRDGCVASLPRLTHSRPAMQAPDGRSTRGTPA